MGQTVSVAPGPAILAKRTDAAILPLFIIRQPDNSHKIIIEPPVERVEDTSQDRSVVLLTMKLARIIESYIAQYPAQWYWATKPHRHTRYHPRLKKALDDLNSGEAEKGKVSFSGK
jgi:KDO2-lipid IV(A) lauroyltransferase